MEKTPPDKNANPRAPRRGRSGRPSLLPRPEAMLEAIAQVQSQFTGSARIESVLGSLLDSLLQLTGSLFGFIGEILVDCDAEARLKTHAALSVTPDPTAGAWLEQWRPHLEISDLQTLFGGAIQAGVPIILNRRQAADWPGAPLVIAQAPVRSFLGLPFLRGDQLVGMAGIANRPSGYEESLIRYLRPLQITAANVITAFRRESKLQQTEAALQETERRLSHQEQKLVLERKGLELRKLESLGVMAGGIAHDFNNLLTGVLGNATLARTQLPAGSPMHHYLQRIEESGQRAADLCAQLLAYSGRGRRSVQELDLSTLVIDTSHLLRLFIGGKARLEFDLAYDLPPVMADRTQMRQVILNLVSNASEAIGDRAGEIFVRTGTLQAEKADLSTAYPDLDLPEGAYVFLEVEDTGCGMSPEVQARIFEPFFTSKFPGRGLGLAAVLGIVRGHRGAVKVTSQPDAGSTFKLLLPAFPRTAEPRQAKSSLTQWNGQGRLLVVDDEETVRTAAVSMAEACGFEVLSAQDGHEALDRLNNSSHRFDLVLLDLTMPGLDGEGTIRALRQLYPDLPVVLMSGFNEQDALRSFKDHGLAAFLQKPFTLDTLRQTLCLALETSANPARQLSSA